MVFMPLVKNCFPFNSKSLLLLYEKVKAGALCFRLLFSFSSFSYLRAVVSLIHALRKRCLPMQEHQKMIEKLLVPYLYFFEFDKTVNISPATSVAMTTSIPNPNRAILFTSSFIIPARITPPNTNFEMSMLYFPNSANTASFLFFSIRKYSVLF